MNPSTKSVIEKMFAAFGRSDIEQFLETVSPDTKWRYHGTNVIPKGTYKGSEGARVCIRPVNATQL